MTELVEAAAAACSAPRCSAWNLRAAQLTELGDAHESLLRLGGLLGEVGIALVGLASGADDEATYWQCMEAIDAADEARDRVLEMLRRLAVRDQVLSERDAAAG